MKRAFCRDTNSRYDMHYLHDSRDVHHIRPLTWLGGHICWPVTAAAAGWSWHTGTWLENKAKLLIWHHYFILMPVHKRWQASTRSRQGRSHGSGQKIARLDRPHELGQKIGTEAGKSGAEVEKSGQKSEACGSSPRTGPGLCTQNLEQQRIPNHFFTQDKKTNKSNKKRCQKGWKKLCQNWKHDEIDKNYVKNQLKKVTSKVTKNKYYHK